LRNPMKEFLFLLIFSISVTAQIRYETKAVWLTTNYGLDWPHTTNPAEQKKSLEEIFDSIKAKNLNTVYFQVRGNGYVLFRSSFEDFSPRVTGFSKQPPEFDPLEYALKLARERSLELHAWINVLKIYGTRFQRKPESERHLLNKHPEWIYKVVENGITSYWLNPALPGVREYIVNLIAELVRNYNVDGIHLDFLRYSNLGIDDGKIKNRNEKDTGDWRRNNITKLLEEIFHTVKNINPLIEVGVTPVGINKNTRSIRGMEGYNEVYQDSEEWVARGIVDYLAPQIYWDIENNPKFEDVLNQWLKIAGNINLVAGIAAYKPWVLNQIDDIIKIVRRKTGTGYALFRYENIKNLRISDFNDLTLPPRKEIADFDGENESLKITSTGFRGNKLRIKWSYPDSLKRGVRAYLVLVKNNKNGFQPVKIVNNDCDSVGIEFNKFDRLVYRFKILPLNIVWKPLQNSGGMAEVYNHKLLKLSTAGHGFNKPVLLKKGNKLKIVITSGGNESVKIYSKTGNGFNLVRQSGIQKGINVLSINKTSRTEEILILLGGREYLLKF